MSKIQKYTINVIPNFYWCHIAPDGFSSLLFPEHKIEFYFNGKMTASYTVKKESIPDVLPTYCYITEMLNKGSFSLSKESLDKLCSPEFREVLDYVKEMRLTHYYLGYIELTPSIYYYRYNKFHGEYAIEGKLYNIKKIVVLMPVILRQKVFMLTKIIHKQRYFQIGSIIGIITFFIFFVCISII